MKCPASQLRAWQALPALLLAALLPQQAAGASLRAARGHVGANDTGSGSVLADFDHLRLSVVRIQSTSSKFDWSRPFIPGYDGVGLGSGFVVQTDPYPLFVTNAHVINDAKHVALQLLLYGARQWEAKVVYVDSKFDMALLVLTEPQVFTETLGKRNITLKSLELAEGATAMGEDVVALGFPLGQDALKISKGNIAGNEPVNGNICIQSTAPISPGNSGGPLLDAMATKVVGINFAKSTVGENINYVIPAWRVIQMVAKHLHDQPSMPKDGKWKRLQARFPSPDLTTIKANDALYAMSPGCSQGLYISRVGKRSLFKTARPPVADGSFLISVNGLELDRYGTGLAQTHVADRVKYTDLIFMGKNLSADLKVKTCAKGNIVTHTVSMMWLPEYERGLRYVDEPNMEGYQKAYEMFGDITFMDMTVNHVNSAIERGIPGPVRWLHPDFVAEPRLVVGNVRQGSYVASIVSSGSAVSKVNGVEVRSLKDLRKHFAPQNGSNFWTLETDMGKFVAFEFNKSISLQVAQANQLNAPYLLTPGCVSAAQRLGLEVGFGLDSAEKQVAKGSGAGTTQTLGPMKKTSLLHQGEELHGADSEDSEDGDADSLEAVAAGPLLVQKSPRFPDMFVTERHTSAMCEFPVDI